MMLTLVKITHAVEYHKIEVDEDAYAKEYWPTSGTVNLGYLSVGYNSLYPEKRTRTYLQFDLNGLDKDTPVEIDKAELILSYYPAGRQDIGEMIITSVEDISSWNSLNWYSQPLQIGEPIHPKYTIVGRDHHMDVTALIRTIFAQKRIATLRLTYEDEFNTSIRFYSSECFSANLFYKPNCTDGMQPRLLVNTHMSLEKPILQDTSIEVFDISPISLDWSIPSYLRLLEQNSDIVDLVQISKDQEFTVYEEYEGENGRVLWTPEEEGSFYWRIKRGENEDPENHIYSSIGNITVLELLNVKPEIVRNDDTFTLFTDLPPVNSSLMTQWYVGGRIIENDQITIGDICIGRTEENLSAKIFVGELHSSESDSLLIHCDKEDELIDEDDPTLVDPHLDDPTLVDPPQIDPPLDDNSSDEGSIEKPDDDKDRGSKEKPENSDKDTTTDSSSNDPKDQLGQDSQRSNERMNSPDKIANDLKNSNNPTPPNTEVTTTDPEKQKQLTEPISNDSSQEYVDERSGEEILGTNIEKNSDKNKEGRKIEKADIKCHEEDCKGWKLQTLENIPAGKDLYWIRILLVHEDLGDNCSSGDRDCKEKYKICGGVEKVSTHSILHVGRLALSPYQKQTTTDLTEFLFATKSDLEGQKATLRVSQSLWKSSRFCSTEHVELSFQIEKIPQAKRIPDPSDKRPYSFPFPYTIGVTQWHGNTVFSKPHTGIDFGATLEPIFALSQGVVASAGYDRYYGECQSGGYYLNIKHPDGKHSVYMHLDGNSFSKYKWKVGDPVRKAQTLGLSGNSGSYNCQPLGYHLHLETRDGSAQSTHTDPVRSIRYDWDDVLTINAERFPGRLSGDNPHPWK